MSSAKWRPFCLGLNELIKKESFQNVIWKMAATLSQPWSVRISSMRIRHTGNHSHHSDVTWLSWHQKSLVNSTVVQQLCSVLQQENTKAPYHWIFVKRNHNCILRTKGQSYKKYLNVITSSCPFLALSWWRHQMETFSALLAVCAGNSPVPGEFPSQRPVTRSFDVFFDLRLNKWLSKQSWGWWFETLSSPLWCHCNMQNCPVPWRSLEWITTDSL